ncbi:MAG: prepilin peptidase [Acidobacteria bacterium]|nr:prepilin peptidase [Acidobacteriota bacterium]
MHVVLIFYTVLGLIIGSFLNVCIYRIPLRKSIVFPRSSCTRCGRQIPFYDNIPVLSWILLQGKCRFCGASISFQYPFVELLTGAAFLVCGLKWNFTPPTYVNSLFLSATIVLIFTDFHHRILPNVLTLPGIIAGILLSPFQDPAVYMDVLSVKIAGLFEYQTARAVLPWAGSVSGAVIGGGILLVIGFGYQKLRKRQGLGMGDIKMMAMVGAFLGWRLTFLTIFAGSFLGLLAGMYLIVFHKQTLQAKLPFGVFLGIGSALALFYGLPFLEWYLPA